MYERRPTWSNEELIFLKTNTHLTAEQIANTVGRSVKSVKLTAETLGLKLAPMNGYSLWSSEEDKLIVNTDISIKELANMLNRTQDSVLDRRIKLRQAQGYR